MSCVRSIVGVRMSKHVEIKKITVNTIQKIKTNGDKISCITAYDYTSASMVDQAGIDLILVGDSLGMVVDGYESTLPVTVDEIIYHAKSVKRGANRAFLVADMPFGSYHVSDEQAMENCVRVIKETGFDAVKIEGGAERADLVRKLTMAGINVMGHIGLMPQMVNVMGGYKIQGRDGGESLMNDALALEKAGAFAIVLEGVVGTTAKKITNALTVPTVGIGAGVGCDGQILVFHDVFGFFNDFTPKFVKRYADVRGIVTEACKQYINDVKESKFPEDIHTF